MSQSRVADADATETHCQFRFERVAHPAWLDGRLAHPATVADGVAIRVHAQHMTAELCSCINTLFASDPIWRREFFARVARSPDTDFVGRMLRVPAEELPAATPAIVIRGEHGTVWVVSEDHVTEALAVELRDLLAAISSRGPWDEYLRERQAS
jgi:hypothetical protein